VAEEIEGIALGEIVERERARKEGRCISAGVAWTRGIYVNGACASRREGGMRKKSLVCDGDDNLKFDISNLKWKAQFEGAGWKSFVP
jgi:hypothetical protein